jgi:hypothetical protein
MPDVTPLLQAASAGDPHAGAELLPLVYDEPFEEAAGVLGIAVPTAKQWWGYARAWLRVEITGIAPGGPPVR